MWTSAINAHLDVLPAASLAISNLASMSVLDRRWRGVAMGDPRRRKLNVGRSDGAPDVVGPGLVALAVQKRSGLLVDVLAETPSTRAR